MITFIDRADLVADLQQAGRGTEAAQEVVRFSHGRGVLVAKSEIEGEFRSNAPVILDGTRVIPLSQVSFRVPGLNGPVRRHSCQQGFERREAWEGLNAEEIDRAFRRATLGWIGVVVTEISTKLDGMLAPQVGNV